MLSRVDKMGHFRRREGLLVGAISVVVEIMCLIRKNLCLVGKIMCLTVRRKSITRFGSQEMSPSKSLAILPIVKKCTYCIPLFRMKVIPLSPTLRNIVC